jgi:hypothetical protein
MVKAIRETEENEVELRALHRVALLDAVKRAAHLAYGEKVEFARGLRDRCIALLALNGFYQASTTGAQFGSHDIFNATAMASLHVPAFEQLGAGGYQCFGAPTLVDGRDLPSAAAGAELERDLERLVGPKVGAFWRQPATVRPWRRP